MFEENIIEYYSNGSIRLKGQKSGGVYNGPFIEYHENGKVAKEYQYKMGLLTGEHREYWIDSDKYWLRKKCYYKDGFLEGYETEYSYDNKEIGRNFYGKGYKIWKKRITATEDMYKYALIDSIGKLDFVTIKLLVEEAGADINCDGHEAVLVNLFYIPTTEIPDKNNREDAEYMLETVFNYLLENGVKPNENMTGKVIGADYDWSPLMFLARMSFKDFQIKKRMILKLIGYGADVNFGAKAGDCPITRAIISKDVNTVKLILDQGADTGVKVTLPSPDGFIKGCSLLFQAIYDADRDNDDVRIVELLLNRVPELLDKKNGNGDSPLVYAAKRRRKNIFLYLLNKNTDETEKKKATELAVKLGLKTDEYRMISNLTADTIVEESISVDMAGYMQNYEIKTHEEPWSAESVSGARPEIARRYLPYFIKTPLNFRAFLHKAANVDKTAMNTTGYLISAGKRDYFYRYIADPNLTSEKRLVLFIASQIADVLASENELWGHRIKIIHQLFTTGETLYDSEDTWIYNVRTFLKFCQNVNIGEWVSAVILQIIQKHGKSSGNIYRFVFELLSKSGPLNFLSIGLDQEALSRLSEGKRCGRIFNGGSSKRLWALINYLRRDNGEIKKILIDSLGNSAVNNATALDYWYNNEYFNENECEMPIDYYLAKKWAGIVKETRNKKPADISEEAYKAAKQARCSPAIFHMWLLLK